MTKNIINEKLLRRVTSDIEKDRFLWKQGEWVGFSEPVNSGVAFEDLPNECGTAYCFAGRVAALSREQLYRRYSLRRYGLKSYTPLNAFIPHESDAKTMEATTGENEEPWLYRAIKGEDGKTKFVPYAGFYIDAESAATQDLNISSRQAGYLFDADNSLNDIQEYIDAFIQGDEF